MQLNEFGGKYLTGVNSTSSVISVQLRSEVCVELMSNCCRVSQVVNAEFVSFM